MRKSGKGQGVVSPEDEVIQIKKQTAKLQAQYEMVNTADALANPPTLQQIREQRQTEIEAQARRAEDESRRLHEENRTRILQERDDAAQRYHEEEQRRQELERNFYAQQQQVLLDKLKDMQDTRKPFDQQLEESMGFAERIAERMGFQKGAAAAPGGDNPQMQLEITKLQIQAAQQEREFQWKMEQEKREWDMKLVQLRQDREFKQAEVERQSKRDDWLSSLPQSIGSAFAKGLREQPSSPETASQRVAQQPSKPRTFEVGMNPGEQATVPCPNCQTPVGIGPETESAQCVGCNSGFTVRRGEGPPPPPPSDNDQIPQYYEEDV